MGSPITGTPPSARGEALLKESPAAGPPSPAGRTPTAGPTPTACGSTGARPAINRATCHLQPAWAGVRGQRLSHGPAASALPHLSRSGETAPRPTRAEGVQAAATALP